MTKKKLIIGIQGGRGSFNEEACYSYCKEHSIDSFEVKYLYTTRGVLKALHEKKIDRGMFAIENTLGGAVMETINALSRYNCRILDRHSLNISHTLFALESVDSKEIKTIMSHPQALTQCKKTLARLYPKRKTVSGEGTLIDSATALKALSGGRLSKTTAVLAPPMNDGFYSNITTIKKGLRDKRQNYTLFLFAGRFNGKS